MTKNGTLQIKNHKLPFNNLKFKIWNLEFLPCACLLDSVKDTPLYTNWLLLFIGALFFLGASVALFLAWKGGYLNLKDIEEVKYKMLEDYERN